MPAYRSPVTGRFTTPTEFANDLRQAGREVPKQAVTVTEETCKRVVAKSKKNVLRTAPIHNAGAYKYIDFEVNGTAGGVNGIVGYNRAYRPARLGNLLEFGGGGDPSPAHYDIAFALESESERYYDKIADMAEALLQSRWDAKGLNG